mgnify:CR=1 FL=1
MPASPKTDKTERKNKSAVPSVEKAIDIIELLSLHPDGLTMNDIAEALDRTMGELYRIVVYMAERDYLQQDPATSKYALTLRLYELSHRFDPTERMLRNGIPLMESYAAKTDQSCHLGVLNRTNVLVLASVPSPRPAGYSVRTGAMFPVEQTSTASVVMAFSAPADQARYLDRLKAEERARAEQRLQAIQGAGFEQRQSTLVNGVNNLSVPVFDNRGVAAALTSGYIEQPNQIASPEEALALMRDMALNLSQSLGFQLDSSPYAGALVP